MLVTDDIRLAEKARSLRNLTFQPNRRFYHEQLGFNFRLTNLQAALGLAQVNRMDQIVAKKRWIAEEYTRRFKHLPLVQLPVEESWARNIYWMYGLVLSEELSVSATEFARRLSQRGVETRPFFLGMHQQPVFHQQGLFLHEEYPVAERLGRQGLYLPSGLALTEDELTQVCDAVEASLAFQESVP